LDYNFQTGDNEIKLLMENKKQTQEVLLFTESILLNAKQLQHAQLSWHVRVKIFRPRKT
jgi:hypothetical protein